MSNLELGYGIRLEFLNLRLVTLIGGLLGPQTVWACFSTFAMFAPFLRKSEIYNLSLLVLIVYSGGVSTSLSNSSKVVFVFERNFS